MRSESNFAGKKDNTNFAMGDVLLMDADYHRSDPYSQTNAWLPNPTS